jgi:hypothetical protein
VCEESSFEKQAECSLQQMVGYIDGKASLVTHRGEISAEQLTPTEMPNLLQECCAEDTTKPMEQICFVVPQ